MRTVSWDKVVQLVAGLAQMDPLQVDSDTWKTWRDLGNARLADWAWNAGPWPESKGREELTVTVEQDDEGEDLRAYVAVPEDAAHVLAIWNKQPHASDARELNFELDETGDERRAVIQGENLIDVPETVWVDYRREAPELTGDVYDGEETYAVGEQIYHGGDFWNCAQAARVNESPSTHPTKWERVELPSRLRAPLARGIYADWLPEESRGKNGAQMAAENALLSALDLVERMEGQRGGQMEVAV